MKPFYRLLTYTVLIFQSFIILFLLWHQKEEEHCAHRKENACQPYNIPFMTSAARPAAMPSPIRLPGTAPVPHCVLHF